MAKLHPSDDQKHANRISKYTPFRNELRGCKPAMPLENIDEFEEMNNLAIKVYGIEGTKITPLRTSVREDARDSIDLLLVEDGDRRHYALIKNLHKLLKPAATNKSVKNLLH